MPLLLISSVWASCASEDVTLTPSNAPWDFSRPAATFHLPLDLAEISGLTFLDSTRLGAVQDEKGSLYVIDAVSGAVEREVPFGDPGDYEGIERAGRRLFVLRSNGALIELDDWPGASLRAREILDGIPGPCDAEGLGYDAISDRLLIACKVGPSQSGEHTRLIFAFDLTSNKLLPSPEIVLDAGAIIRHPKYDSGINRSMRLLAERFTDISGVSPSAIAVDEATHRIYVLSSGHMTLLALDRSGQLIDLWPLPEDHFPQPEGMALAPDGALYISNESPSGGTILRFDPT